MEDKLFTLLGLGVPFYMAAATYAVFAWLDNNASDEATKVISAWLRGRSKNKPDLGNLIISAFDRLYTSPLLRVRAFIRSATISSIIWLLVLFLPWVIVYTLMWKQMTPEERQRSPSYLIAIPMLVFHLAPSLFIVVLSDYISLLFVRRLLTIARIYPIGASFMSTIIGGIVVYIGFIIYLVCDSIATDWPYYHGLSGFIAALYLATQTQLSWAFAYMTPAMIIHLWLPLFALSLLAARLVFWIFRAVERAQWFLKQGDAHPLKAISIVATIIVFGSAMLVKEGWALLGVLERP